MQPKDPTIKDLSFKIDDLANTVYNLTSATAGGFENVMKEIGSVRTDLSKKIEDEIRSVEAEISLGLREVKEEIASLDVRIESNRKSAVKDINELVSKVAVCESDLSKIKQKIAKLKLAS